MKVVFLFLVSFLSVVLAQCSVLKFNLSVECSDAEVKVSFPIDSFANMFIFERVSGHEEQIFNFKNTEPIGMILKIPSLEVFYYIYLSPNDTMQITLDNNCELDVTSIHIPNILSAVEEFSSLSREYLFKKNYYPDCIKSTKKSIANGLTILRDHVLIKDTLILSYYERDFLFSIFSSIFHQIGRVQDVPPTLFQTLYAHFGLKHNKFNSLSNYSHYYFVSFFENPVIQVNLLSDYFQNHYFILSDKNSLISQYVVMLHYVMGVKSQILKLMGEECVAYYDALEFVNIPIFREILMEYGELCN